jgi:hypothetical protein
VSSAAIAHNAGNNQMGKKGTRSPGVHPDKDIRSSGSEYVPDPECRINENLVKRPSYSGRPEKHGNVLDAYQKEFAPPLSYPRGK